jgi:tetratricopeptide (TPR) repeat protein
MTNPRTAAEFFQRGASSHRAGDLPGALADFEAAAHLEPANAELRNICGAMRQALGDVDGALADFEAALRLNPAYAEALNNRGVLHLQRGDQGRAQTDFDAALRVAPTYVEAYSNRGVARQNRGDTAGAIADFDRALELRPGFLDAIRNRALARRESGELPAVDDLDEALARAPESAALYFDRASVHLVMANWEGALADLDRCLALDPRYTEAYIYRGNARHHKGDPAAFVDHLCGFRLDGPLTVREIVEIVHWDLVRDPERLLRNCANHLSKWPDDPVGLTRRAIGLLLLDRTEEALADRQRVIDLGPEYRLLWESLDAAVAELRASLRQQGGPLDPGMHWLRKLRCRTAPQASGEA